LDDLRPGLGKDHAQSSRHQPSDIAPRHHFRGDVHLEERDISAESNSYIVSQEKVVGRLAKCAVTNTTALCPNMLNEPLLVHRGQEIIILAEGSGIQVMMAGTALMHGAEGQIIRAQNKPSKRAVPGQVIKGGIIRANM
jgi:flagella basal body P-ring formation protein FlgA